MYPKYYEPRSPEEQVKFYKKTYCYSSLDFSWVEEMALTEPLLPEGAELYQVVPKWSAAKKLLRWGADPYDVIFSEISAQRRFFNTRVGTVKPFLIRPLSFTAKIRMILEDLIPGDFLLIPMQSGKLYKDIPPENARNIIKQTQTQTGNVPQWGFGLWEVLHHIFVHPERMSGKNCLSINCAGDEYDQQGYKSWGSFFLISFCSRCLLLESDLHPEKITYPNSGMATGFINEKLHDLVFQKISTMQNSARSHVEKLLSELFVEIKILNRQKQILDLRSTMSNMSPLKFSLSLSNFNDILNHILEYRFNLNEADRLFSIDNLKKVYIEIENREAADTLENYIYEMDMG